MVLFPPTLQTYKFSHLCVALNHENTKESVQSVKAILVFRHCQ